MDTIFCGRRFIHVPHDWEAPAIIPLETPIVYHCEGQDFGPTEEEFIRGRHHHDPEPENTEESTEDALRRFAGIVAKIEEFINDENNWLDPFEPIAVPVAELKAIIHPEDK
jgi:hypothetical protein